MNRANVPALLVLGANVAAGALVVATAVLAAPAFASGLGPAPWYNPSVGAPAEQRGVSAQTVAAEARRDNAAIAAFGGTRDTAGEAGTRHAADAGATTSGNARN